MPYASNLLTVIITHGGFPVAAKNHTPLWKAHGRSMLTYFPSKSLTDEAPANYPVSPQVSYGAAGKLDPLSSDRFVWLLNHLIEHTEADYFLLFTQATICLQPQLPAQLFENDVLWGAFPPADKNQLSATVRPQWPLFFSRKIAKKLYGVIFDTYGAKTKAKGETTPAEPAKALSLPSELELWSELIASLVGKRLIEIGALANLAFARDVIETTDEQACLRAIRSEKNGGTGAIFLHGVQSTVALNRNIRMYQYAYDQRNEEDRPHDIGVTIQKGVKFDRKVVTSSPTARPQFR